MSVSVDVKQQEKEERVLLTERKYFRLVSPPDEWVLESGEILPQVDVCYETFGTLNKEGTNCIYIAHALTGDSHCCGKYKSEDKKSGWWDGMVGPGRAFDSDKYFIVCMNILGGCQGTTGPSSIDPRTGKPYGMNFPVFTIRDMVKIQKALFDFLGVKKLVTVSGGSMGGMQALEWAMIYPDFLLSSIPMATSGKLSPQSIAFNKIGRRAIMLDPKWNNGDYYPGHGPTDGLSLARMVGTITYKSDALMNVRFGRKHGAEKEKDYYHFQNRFEVENFLRYHGEALVNRFDANCYLYLTKAMDLHDVGVGRSSYEKAFELVKCRTLVVGISSDFLFPVYQQKEIVELLKMAGKDVEYWEMDSEFGHDAFLIEFDKMTPVIKDFLERIEEKQ